MIEYLDFFLQVFVHALAWCLAIVLTFTLCMVGAAAVLKAYAYWGGRRPTAARGGFK